jgi:predicted CXXCH cytochrome family protein
MKKMPFIAILLICLTWSGSGRALADSCVTATCHGAIGALHNLHPPVKDGDCSSCHTQRVKEHPVTGVKSFALVAKGAELCSNCHTLPGKKKMVHAPVKEGDCVACHKPHGASGRFLLNSGEDRTALCTGCHDAEPFKQKYMHGPAAVGSCNACHDPHESNEKTLLKGKVRDLCLQCHSDFAQALQEAVFVHPPVKNDPCTACHNPHGSSVVMFLKKGMPDLCVGCHPKVGRTLAKVKVPHKPVMEQGGCANCHSAHFSKARKLLAADEMTICLSCHGKDNVGKPALQNIKAQMEGKKFLHGPIKKGQCTACHDPHGSDYFRMLAGNYPKTLYAPYQEGAYGACLKCHEKNLLKFPETTIYTKFRNGKRNLHFVHVAGRKGRSCRVCHEPHASDGERLIRKEGAQFGGWKIPLNFKITSTGGSCEPGCHRAFKYDREKAEAL